MPSIALIIPLWNEAERLPALLSMIPSLTVDEVVLVDGGSTDGSRELLATSGIRWITALTGRAHQMNAGAALCQSDILLFLHADTTISAADIQQLRTALQEPSLQSGHFDIRLDNPAWIFQLIATMINLRSQISSISTGDQGQFVRRQLFEQLRGFPQQPLMEDVELSKRLKKMGGVLTLHCPITTSSRRWQQHGIIRTIVLMWWLRLRYCLGASPDHLARYYQQERS